MNMNFKHFKKISDDKNKAVFKHPDGHNITVAKNVLSPKMRGEIAALPVHLEEGTPDKPIPFRSEGAQQEQARAADPSFQQEFPEAAPVQKAQQPTIVINNTPPPQQAQAPAPVAPLDIAPPEYDPKKAAYQMMADPRVGDMAKEAIAKKNDVNMSADQINRVIPQEAMRPSNLPQMAPPPELQQANAPNAQVAGPQAPQAQQDPYGTEAYLNAYTQGLGGQKEGINQQAATEGAIGQQQSEALNKQILAQQETMKSYQDNWKALEQERKSFMADYQNKHIDPNRMLNSMGTSQRIMTGIGLILGGMGGGMLHMENPAMKFLNQQIENDINAQKAELGKSETLLGANMKQFGNLKDATDMTRVMQSDIVSNQLKEAAAKSADPLAKARALEAAGKLDMQAAPILSQIAMRKGLMSGLQNGALDPSQIIRMIVPEGQQSKAYEELKDAQALAHGKENVISAFDQINKINTLSNRVTSPIQSSKQIDAIMNPVLAELAKDLAGKFTEYDFKIMRDSFPSAGDNEETVAIKKNRLVNLINQKNNFPMLQSYGINVNKMGRYGAGGEKRIQLGAPQISGQR